MADQIIDGEEWRPVVGYAGYEVSNFGRVRSLPRIIVKRNGHRQIVRGCIRKQYLRTDSHHYWYAHMGAGGQYTHILVCTAFHGPKPTAKHKVAHRDGNGLNNAAQNLRWATSKENEADKRLHGRQRRVLSGIEVAEIRQQIWRGIMSTEIAKAYSVHPTTIADIKFRRTWAWLD